MSYGTETSHLPLKVVIHEYPSGPDELIGAWAAMRFLGKDRPEVKLTFVRAGESLPADERVGYEVVHIDTGRGAFDQPNKPELGEISSFQLFAQHYGLDKDPGIMPLLDLTVRADNIRPIEDTSIHYAFKGMVPQFKDPETGEVNWAEYCHMVFTVLDGVYNISSQRVSSRLEFQKKLETSECQIKLLNNGIKVYWVGFRPDLREAAFEHGADVVVMMSGQGKQKFYPIIQTGRGSWFVLDRVNRALRHAEANARGIDPKGIDLWMMDIDPALGGAAWFEHPPSKKMICCGSRSHQLEDAAEFTKLRPFNIFKLTCDALGELPAPT